MLLWHASELHTHTLHSDGKYTVAELLANSVEAGYETVALTDHNTISGLAELPAAARQTGLHVIRGIEWSSYYGHMVTHGARYYIPWHDIGLDDIHKGIALVHEAGGITGIAHPFTIGEPFCLGCHWHFRVTDWNHPDYIEVWNECWPSLEYSNIKAFNFWTEKLNEGYRIYAASGRDWHSDDRQHYCFPVTYVGVEDDRLDDYEAGWLEGMKKGRISVSFGPLLLFELVDGESGIRYGLGGQADRRLIAPEADVLISLDFDRRRQAYAGDHTLMDLKLVGNAGTIWEGKINPEQQSGQFSQQIRIESAGLRWLRCELYGSMKGRWQTVAFTNPVFIS